MNAPLRWQLWITATLTTFLAIEVPALRDRLPDKPPGTLSACMRTWLGVHPRRARRWLTVPAFTAACTWLAVHMCRPDQ